MTELTTTTYSVNCPACDSGGVKKMGVRNGQQRYLCRDCKKAFRVGGKAEGRKMDPELMGSAIRDFYTGKSYKQIAEGLKEEYDLKKEPSKATIYEWVRDYTGKAVKQLDGHKAKTGGQKMWLWNVMDAETRYILASHLTPRRDTNAARVVFRKAALAADKPPKTVTTDKLKSYISAIKGVLPEARHMQSEGMRADINNNLSERLQGTFRDRIKTLRGLDSRKTGQRYLDGWMITYNHFRGHESLRNQTPGYRAKVNPPFKEWADVVKAGAVSPRPKIKEEARPVSQPKPKLSQPQAAPAAPVKKPKQRSSFKMPKPKYPKMAAKKSQKPKVPPPWARLRPRMPSKN